MIGADLRHLEERRDQAVARAAVRDAFAHRVDARIKGLHRVVHHDAAIDVKSRGLREGAVGANADRHHDEIGRNPAAVLEFHRGNAARLARDEGFGLLFEKKPQTLRFERSLQHSGSHLVELALHEPGHEVHDRHVHAACLEPVRRLEPEQPAADHHRAPVARRGLDHRIGVGDVAIRDDARQVLAGNRKDHRAGARGEDQAVVGLARAVRGDHLAPHAVDPRHRLAPVQPDAVLGVPVEAVQHDVLELHLACEHRRKQDPVVVRMGLGAEDGDLVETGREREQFLERAHARHAVADHHQFHLVHASKRISAAERADADGRAIAMPVVTAP